MNKETTNMSKKKKYNHIDEAHTAGNVFLQTLGILTNSFNSEELNSQHKITLELGLKVMFSQNKKHAVILINTGELIKVKEFILKCIKKEIKSGFTIRDLPNGNELHMMLHTPRPMYGIRIYLINPFFMEKDFFRSHYNVDLLISICDNMSDDKFLAILKEWLKNIRGVDDCCKVISDIQSLIIKILEKHNQINETENYLRNSRNYYKSKFEELQESTKSIIENKNKLSNRIKQQEQVIDSIGCLLQHAQEIFKSYRNNNEK